MEGKKVEVVHNIKRNKCPTPLKEDANSLHINGAHIVAPNEWDIK